MIAYCLLEPHRNRRSRCRTLSNHHNHEGVLTYEGSPVTWLRLRQVGWLNFQTKAFLNSAERRLVMEAAGFPNHQEYEVHHEDGTYWRAYRK